MENKRGSEIFLGVIGVATLVVAIIGATFAFFAAGANNTTAITGETATASLTLTVERVAPTTVGKLVPQLAETLDDALVGTQAKGGSCIDGNGNTVCHVYEIVVTNGGTSAVTVDGSLTLTPSGISHLKWVKLATATTLTSALSADGGNTPSTTSLVSSVTLQPTGQSGNSETYYVAVWVEEQNSNQTSADAGGSFTGVVSFISANGTGGVTSTFTA